MGSSLFSVVVPCEVDGAAFDLVEDTPEVLSYDADGDELDTSEEEYDNDEGWETCYGVAHHKGADEIVQTIKQGTEGGEQTHIGGETERGGCERCDAFYSEVEQGEETPFAFACYTRLLLEQNFLFAETYPAVHAFGVSLCLAQLPQGVYRLPVEQAEIAYILEDVKPRCVS